MAEYSTIVAPDKEVAVISDSEGEENYDDGMVEIFYDGSPHITLPPEVWAAIIDYLPYDSLISCASTSKAMLHDVLPLVTTLHIKKASHLRIGIVAKQLKDIRSISIYNLFQKNSDTDDIILDEDIAAQSVHFLSNTFHQLESVAFWGKCGDNLVSLNTVIIDDDQRGYINNLLDSFSGAFSCRTLPQNLQIVGLSCPNTTVDTDGSCKICKRICNKFPLAITGDIDLCLRFATSNEIIKTRKGGQDYLRCETRFMQLLGKSHVSSSRYDFCIIGHDYEVRNELKNITESSKLDVSKLNLDDVVKAIKKRHPNNISIYYLSGDSFDLLKSIGIFINDDKLDPMAVRVENLDRMVRSVMEETGSLISPVDGLNQIDSLLKQQDPPIQRVMESGVLPKLVESLSRDDYEVQLAATRILVNVAAGERKYVEEVVKLGAIPSLVHLLGYAHTELPPNAAWALGNITIGNDHHFRDLVLQTGAMRPLLKLLEDHQTSSVKLVRIYVWTLANLCRDMPKNFDRPPLSTLNELIYHSDEGVVSYTCWALSYVSDCPDEHIQTVIDALGDKGIRRLVELLGYPNTEGLIPALRVMGNIVHAGSNAQMQVIINNNALPSLLSLLSSSSKDVRRETCWAISNISTGTVEQIQAVIDIGIIPQVISLLKDDSLAVRKEAAWVVGNATQKGSSEHVKYLVNQGCIPPLLDLLTVMQDDKKIVTIVLESLKNASQVSTEKIPMESHIKYILDANNGRSMLQELQHHDDDAVRQLSTSILEMHFSSE